MGETLAGVQKQTFGEVAEDVGKEVAIGFVGDGVFGLAAGKAFRGGRRAVKPGKDLTQQNLKLLVSLYNHHLMHKVEFMLIGVLAQEGDVSFGGLRGKINPDEKIFRTF